MTILNLLKKIKNKKDSIKSAIDLEKLKEELRNDPKFLKGDQGDKGDKGDEGHTPVKRIDYFTNEEIDKFKKDITPVKGKDYFDGKKGDSIKGDTVVGPPGPAGIPGKKAVFNEKGLFEKIVEKVKFIFTEREKEMMKILRSEMAKIAQSMDQIGGGGLSRQSVIDLISGVHGKRADLSSQCNGSNMTFNMPEGFVSKSVSLQGTQFPVIYRPVIDFTEDVDNEQISLVASEVGAPKTGQTLVAIYEEKII